MTPGVTSFPFLPSKPPIEEYAQTRFYIDRKRNFFVLKRIVDVIIALVVIILVLIWLTPMLALLIIIDSPGPVFFVQRRVGKAGKTFTCFKFRTMVLNSQAHTKPAAINDARITVLGSTLRRYNIDELPQFVNVLFGNMSVVGPRPHMHADCAAFSSSIRAYKVRTFVKPGITGLAQVRGFHGPASSEEMIRKRFELDAFYVRHASIELDIDIIRSTILQRIRLLVAALD